MFGPLLASFVCQGCFLFGDYRAVDTDSSADFTSDRPVDTPSTEAAFTDGVSTDGASNDPASFEPLFSGSSERDAQAGPVPPEPTDSSLLTSSAVPLPPAGGSPVTPDVNAPDSTAAGAGDDEEDAAAWTNTTADVATTEPATTDRNTSSNATTSVTTATDVTAVRDGGADAAVRPSTSACQAGWSYETQSQLCVLDCATNELREPETGRCYWIGTQDIGFAATRTACSARGDGWELLSVRSETEQAFIDAQLSADTWIGASDANVPDTWRWLDDNTAFWQGKENGMPINGAFARWGTNEPSGANDETCARYHRYNGSWAWSDCDCAGSYRPACQGPAPVVPNAL